MQSVDAKLGTRTSRKETWGFTLVEVIVATTILLILAGIAAPTLRVSLQARAGTAASQALWTMRDAIDRDTRRIEGLFKSKLVAKYPPDLETLVNGVDISGKKLRFLRRIPIDPMTGK